MINLGMLAKYITRVPPEIGNKIKKSMEAYTNKDEEKARELLRDVITDLKQREGYSYMIKYLENNTK
jgi:hypothetical protein